MSTLTEGKHAGEFIISEANGTLSREVITVASGQNLVDGQVIQLSAGKAVAKDATLNTAGDFVTAPEGIIIGNWNATADGLGAADVPGVPYIKRLAEVRESALTLPSDTDGPLTDEIVAALAASNIVLR
jgi:hypothetical protein